MVWDNSQGYNYSMRLKELMKKKGVSKNDLAKTLSVSPETIYRYVYGRTEPDIATLKKLAEIFATSVDYLIEAETPMVDLRTLEDYQQEMFNEMLKLSPRNADKVLGYIHLLNEKDN